MFLMMNNNLFYKPLRSAFHVKNFSDIYIIVAGTLRGQNIKIYTPIL